MGKDAALTATTGGPEPLLPASYHRAMVESSHDAIVGETLDGVVTSWNQAAERIVGYAAAEMLGKPISLLAVPGREDEMRRLLGRIKAGERVEHYDTERRHEDGHIVQISLPVSPIFDLDRIQVQQVLVNIIRNAVEAMRASVRRDLTIHTDLDGDGFIRVGVSDTGPGISAEVMQRLFQPFGTTKPQGMGVGLSLCRAIIEAHGGRLWVESNPSGGATFCFTVPPVVA